MYSKRESAVNIYRYFMLIFYSPDLQPIWTCWSTLVFQGLRGHKVSAIHWLGDIAMQKLNLFAHWAWGVKPTSGRRNRKRISGR